MALPTLPVATISAPWEPDAPADILRQAEEAVRSRREAELSELLACAAWADRFASDPCEKPGHVPTPGGERLILLGGEGTPMVRDLVLVELGVALSRHPLAARAMTADVLDLRHRLPRTWRHVMDGEAEVWVARKAAAMSRAVPASTIAQVDAAVAEAIVGVAPSRVFDIAEAAVIVADPAGHRAKLADARSKRYVGLGRSEDTGLRVLVARLTCGDALYVDAMVQRVADILALRRTADGLAELSRDRLRSEAMGWLARPAELMVLLVSHGHDPETDPFPPSDDWIPDTGPRPERSHDTPEADPASAPTDDLPDGVPAAAPLDDDPTELVADDDVPPEVDTTPARPFALPADVLAALTPQLLDRLRPKATLYVHLHESVLAPLAGDEARVGVARVEGSTHGGPLDIVLLRDLLGHARVTIKPVIDLNEHHAVDAYEHPAWMRERIHLRHPADGLPHASRVSRDVDLDHPVSWVDPGHAGPPGQTTTESQPLSRTAHRAKTHLGWTVVPTPAGLVWRSPHGLHRLVDNHGRTHHLTADDAAILIEGQTELDAALDAALRRLLSRDVQEPL